MSPTVFYRRADEVGALYDLVCQSKLDLEALIQSKEWLAATLLVRDLETFVEGCRTFCDDITQGDDAKLEALFCSMLGRISFHKVVIGLNLAANHWGQADTRSLMRRVLSDASQHVAATFPNPNPTATLVCRICHLALEEFDLCWVRFDKVYAMAESGEGKNISSYIK